MRELLPTLDAWTADGVGAGRAVVVRTFGSAPRPEGAVFLRADDGRIAGSVSGGCVEGAVAEEIARARASGRARVIRYGISDEQAWDVGLACGGTIDVLVEPVVPPAAIEAARAASARGDSGRAIVTTLPADSPGPSILDRSSTIGDAPAPPVIVASDGDLTGTNADAALDGAIAEAGLAALRRGTSQIVEIGGRQRFVEAFPTRRRLVAVGGVEIARPLVAIARSLGYETVVVDGRAAFATPERFPDVDRLVVGWLDEVADDLDLGPNDAVAVLSHDPKLDEPAIAEALRRGCRYVGAIGSRKTQADRRARLRAEGLTDGDLARLHGPIGLDLGGQAPAEIALAIMAEIVAARYGASGQPLLDRVAVAS